MATRTHGSHQEFGVGAVRAPGPGGGHGEVETGKEVDGKVLCHYTCTCMAIFLGFVCGCKANKVVLKVVLRLY